jgi:hypothetical protein
MGKNTLKRSIIIGIIFLFLSTICLPVLAKEKKADLTIDGIVVAPNYWEPGPNFQDLLCSFRNIGDAPTNGLYYKVVVKQMRFGFIPFRIITTKFYNVGIPLAPGETYSEFLPSGAPYGDGMPFFGFIRFEVTVNPDHSTPEWNYENNYYNETFWEFNPIILGFITYYPLW